MAIGRFLRCFRRQNGRIGARLLQEAERRHPDAVRFELFTGSQSLGNLRLYRRLGYEEFRREPLNSRVELVYLEKRDMEKRA